MAASEALLSATALVVAALMSALVALLNCTGLLKAGISGLAAAAAPPGLAPRTTTEVDSTSPKPAAWRINEKVIKKKE
jgi:hypothetical protein